MSLTSTQIIERLGLVPHPEGGHYRETHRGQPLPFDLPGRGPRASSTAIYFLLEPGEFSALHAVSSDEVWHHYCGAALELIELEPDGTMRRSKLGKELERGELPQLVVSAGTLQAARGLGPEPSLVGCTVAPGFDFADFHMPSRAELGTRFPAHAELIASFTRA
ncbi:MAG TPA: cupin domain-containing protein [Polyangiaceae bacterium]|nr:cupin domain-containing protein [Polyangiaceae bacterium]